MTNWTEIAIAVFTGLTALTGALLYRLGRISIGHGQALRLRRPRGDYYVEGPAAYMQWDDRTQIRVARLHVFNRSDRVQKVSLDRRNTRIVWPRLKDQPRCALGNLDIMANEGNNILLPLKSATWPVDTIDPATGFSVRRYWIWVVGITQNGNRLIWFGPVHVKETPPTRQQVGTIA